MEKLKFHEMLEQAKVPTLSQSNMQAPDRVGGKKPEGQEEEHVILGVKQAEQIGAKCDEIQNLLYSQKQLLRENREILGRNDCCNLDSSQMSIDLSTSGDEEDVNSLLNNEAIKAKEDEWKKEKEQYEKKQGDLNS